MKIFSIEKFMETDIKSIDGNLPVTVACKNFLDFSIGSILIKSIDKTIDNKYKYACITKTDIIKIIGKGGDPGLISVEDIASKPLITVKADASLEDAMLKMAKNKIKRIFVESDSEEIIGVISSSDILRIAPGLLEITREENLLQEVQKRPTSYSGYCDNCKKYSDSLSDLGGFALCDNCH